MPKIKQDPSKKLWTEPTLSPKKPTALDMNKSWRVRFDFYDTRTATWETVTRSNNINDYTNFKERLSEANALRSALKFKLEKQGWNPLTNTYHSLEKKKDIDDEIRDMRELSFSAALDLAYQAKLPDWRGKTPQDYSSAILYMKLAAEELGIESKKMFDFELPHFLFLLSKIQERNELTNTGYNKYKSYLSTLLTKLANLHVVKVNCLRDVENKKVLKNNIHRPPTEQELAIVIPLLQEKYPEYYCYLSLEYIGFRPKEICALKIRHWISGEQLFRLDAKDSKTGRFREVPIPDWLMDQLNKMNLKKYPGEWHIFSTRNKYGSFFPGPNRMHSNTTNLWWRRIVKSPVDKGGLGLPINQYSIKKYGGDEMVRLQKRYGVDKLLELPKAMMGHTQTSTTEIYTTEHLEVKKELIKKHLPAL